MKLIRRFSQQNLLSLLESKPFVRSPAYHHAHQGQMSLGCTAQEYKNKVLHQFQDLYFTGVQWTRYCWSLIHTLLVLASSSASGLCLIAMQALKLGDQGLYTWPTLFLRFQDAIVFKCSKTILVLSSRAYTCKKLESSKGTTSSVEHLFKSSQLPQWQRLPKLGFAPTYNYRVVFVIFYPFFVFGLIC